MLAASNKPSFNKPSSLNVKVSEPRPFNTASSLAKATWSNPVKTYPPTLPTPPSFKVLSAVIVQVLSSAPDNTASPLASIVLFKLVMAISLAVMPSVVITKLSVASLPVNALLPSSAAAIPANVTLRVSNEFLVPVNDAEELVVTLFLLPFLNETALTSDISENPPKVILLLFFIVAFV